MKVDGEYTFDGPQDVVWDALLDPDVLAGVLPGCEKLELVGENEYEGALRIKVGPVQGQFQGRVKLEDIQPPDRYTMQVDGRGAPGFVKATGHLALTAAGEKTHVTYDGDAQVGGKLASVGQRLVESSAKAIIKQSLDGLNAAVRARASEQAQATRGATPAAGAPDAAAAAHSSVDTPADAGAAATSAEASGSATNGTGASTHGSTGAVPPGGTAARRPAATRPAAPPQPPSQAKFAAAVAREVAKDLIPAPVRYILIAVVALAIIAIAYVLIT